MRSLWPILAIFGRDWRIAASYRLNALLTLGSMIFSVTLWYFFSRAVSPSNAATWATGGYFGYLITGTACMGLVNVALTTFGRKLREQQMTGTLEVFLGSPAPSYLILFASLLWDLAVQLVQVAATVGAAILFGMHLQMGSVVALVALVLLTLVVFAALGLSAASLILIFQRGEPVTPFVGAFFALMGGVFFPPTVLPAAMADLSRLLPLPYALSGLRGLALQGWTFSQAWPDIQALLIFAAVLMPISLLVFPACLAFARRYGLLATY